MKHVVNPYISKYEERFLQHLARHLYHHVHHDFLTLVAILSSVISFVFYLNGNFLATCPFIFLHYICDGLDGKIARLRQPNRKNGVWIDRVSDYVCSCFFVAGFFYATTKNIFIVVFLLCLATIVHLMYSYYIFKRKIDVKLGGTESRIILVILNISTYLRASIKLVSAVSIA